MQDTRNTPWMDALTTAVGPVIWGSTYIVTTELLPPDRPFTAALLRTLPAGLLLVLAALNIGVFQALLFVAAYRLPGGVAAVVAPTPCGSVALRGCRRWRCRHWGAEPRHGGAAGLGVAGAGHDGGIAGGHAGGAGKHPGRAVGHVAPRAVGRAVISRYFCY